MDKKGKLAVGLILLTIVVGIIVASAVMAPPPQKECRDGLDNDGDGAIDYPADGGCSSKNDDDETNCGDNVCEGGETYSSCSLDCAPPQVCGNNVTEGTEVCDGTDLNGQSCSSQGYDGGTLNCAGTCDYFVTTSCYDNSCSDTDGGISAFVAGTTSGNMSGTPYSNNDVCVNADDVREYYCSGDVEASTIIQSEPDGSGDLCIGNDVYTNNSVNYCSSGALVAIENFTFKTDCGEDSAVNICINNSVYTNVTDVYCAGSSCGSSTYAVFNESCALGCSNGACLEPICGNNVTEAPETCDGSDLNGQTCASQGYSGGTLGCQSGCGAYDTSGCYTNSCVDADFGVNVTLAANVTWTYLGTPTIYSDTCINATAVVRDYTCVGIWPSSEDVDCIALNFSGCSAGACI